MNTLLFKRALFLQVKPLAMRPFSTLMQYTPQDMLLIGTYQQEIISEFEEANKTLECKKNKTTKQAERKRKKRKTGADINIRYK